MVSIDVVGRTSRPSEGGGGLATGERATGEVNGEPHRLQWQAGFECDGEPGAPALVGYGKVARLHEREQLVDAMHAGCVGGELVAEPRLVA